MANTESEQTSNNAPGNTPERKNDGPVKDNPLLQGVSGAVIIVAILVVLGIVGVLIYSHSQQKKDNSRSASPAGVSLRL